MFVVAGIVPKTRRPFFRGALLCFAVSFLCCTGQASAWPAWAMFCVPRRLSAGRTRAAFSVPSLHWRCRFFPYRRESRVCRSVFFGKGRFRQTRRSLFRRRVPGQAARCPGVHFILGSLRSFFRRSLPDEMFAIRASMTLPRRREVSTAFGRRRVVLCSPCRKAVYRVRLPERAAHAVATRSRIFTCRACVDRSACSGPSPARERGASCRRKRPFSGRNVSEL